MSERSERIVKDVAKKIADASENSVLGESWITTGLRPLSDAVEVLEKIARPFLDGGTLNGNECTSLARDFLAKQEKSSG